MRKTGLPPLQFFLLFRYSVAEQLQAPRLPDSLLLMKRGQVFGIRQLKDIEAVNGRILVSSLPTSRLGATSSREPEADKQTAKEEAALMGENLCF